MTTTYAADTFSRANGPVGTAETGGAWVASGAASTWLVASDHVTGRSNSGYPGLLTINDGHSDGAVQATFISGVSAGLVFRSTSATDYWVLSFGAAQYIRLSYFNGGYTTKADPGNVAAAGDIFRVELTGSTIVVFQNGTRIISLTDTTRATATGFGLMTSGSGLTTFDTFSHYSLASTPPDTTRPSVPTGLTATAGSGQVVLAWSASTDNVAVTGYRVYRGGTLLTAPTATGYTDSAVTAGTTYSYTVSSVDAAGNESTTTAAVTATPTGTTKATVHRFFNVGGVAVPVT